MTPSFESLTQITGPSELIEWARRFPLHGEWEMQAYRYLVLRVAMIQGLVIKTATKEV